MGLEGQGMDYRDFKQKEYDGLAQLIRDYLVLAKVYEIMNTWVEGS